MAVPRQRGLPAEARVGHIVSAWHERKLVNIFKSWESLARETRSSGLISRR